MANTDNQIDFKRIGGPCDNPQDNFQQLCSQLLLKDFPNAKPVNGKGGDHGLDTYVGKSPSEPELVWQSKYLLGPFKRTQKRQVEKSLDSVLGYKSLKQWILCIPRDFNIREQEWFYHLEERAASARVGLPQINLSLMMETVIRNLLCENPGIAFTYFPYLSNKPPEKSLIIHDFESGTHDIIFKITNLSDNLLIIYSIRLEVIHWSVFKNPPPIGARIETYEYHVDLRPKMHGEIPVTERQFKYAKGDIDEFKIICHSPPCNRYKVKIHLYCGDAATNKKFKVSTPEAELLYYNYSINPISKYLRILK